ncbi:hypothetical protein HRbin20_01127 [bacterium HR20]|nr:hypothetical protein HRbin20_01127 [bacterium HR20]
MADANRDWRNVLDSQRIIASLSDFQCAVVGRRGDVELRRDGICADLNEPLLAARRAIANQSDDSDILLAASRWHKTDCNAHSSPRWNSEGRWKHCPLASERVHSEQIAGRIIESDVAEDLLDARFVDDVNGCRAAIAGEHALDAQHGGLVTKSLDNPPPMDRDARRHVAALFKQAERIGVVERLGRSECQDVAEHSRLLWRQLNVPLQEDELFASLEVERNGHHVGCAVVAEHDVLPSFLADDDIAKINRASCELNVVVETATAERNRDNELAWLTGQARVEHDRIANHTRHERTKAEVLLEFACLARWSKGVRQSGQSDRNEHAWKNDAINRERTAGEVVPIPCLRGREVPRACWRKLQ